MANNAWFVAFAPRENPEVVVAALFENGVESYNAVPIVRDVLKAYFDKKARESAAHAQRQETALMPGPLFNFAIDRTLAALKVPLPEGFRR